MVVNSESRVSMGLNTRTLTRRQIVSLTADAGEEKLVIMEWLPDSPTGGPASARLVYRRK